MPSYCTSCGFKNEDDAGFCESCGVAITRGPSRAEQGATPLALAGTSQALAPVRSSRWGLWLAVSAVLVGAIGVAVAEFVLPSRPISRALAGWGLQVPWGGGGGNVLYMVGRDGKWGYVDNTGATVIPFEFDKPPSFGKRAAADARFQRRASAPYPVFKSGAWLLVDRQGRRVGTSQFDDVRTDVRAAIVCGRASGRWGCIGETGHEVIPRRYQDLSAPMAGVLAFKEGSRWGLLDDKGNVLLAPTLLEAPSFNDDGSAGLAKFSDGKFGLIDRTGKEVTTMRFKAASVPSRSEWAVRPNGGWAVADLHGRVLVQIPASEKIIGLSSKGEGVLSAFAAEWGGGLMDSKGQWTVKPTKWLIQPRAFSEGRAVFDHDSRLGTVGLDGQIVVPCVFNDLTAYVGSAAIGDLDGQARLIDLAGNVIWPKDVRDGKVRQARGENLIGHKWVALETPGGFWKGFELPPGTTFEFNGQVLRVSQPGVPVEEHPFKVGVESHGWVPLLWGRAKFMMYEDRLLLMFEDHRPTVFRDIGRSDFSQLDSGVAQAKPSGELGSPPEAEKAKSTANETIGGMISKIFPSGSGSSGSEFVGKWRDRKGSSIEIVRDGDSFFLVETSLMGTERTPAILSKDGTLQVAYGAMPFVFTYLKGSDTIVGLGEKYTRVK